MQYRAHDQQLSELLYLLVAVRGAHLLAEDCELNYFLLAEALKSGKLDACCVLVATGVCGRPRTMMRTSRWRLRADQSLPRC